MNDSAQIRLNMVDSQLRTNKVTNPAVISAFLELPRERFAPAPLKGSAYLDQDLPIGRGRYLLEPMVLARLLQTAGIRTTDTVLVIGCGTGYAAAAVGRLARSVVALESESGFAAEAKSLLQDLGARNVTLIEAPLNEGYKAHAPYDAIVIDGAVAAVPDMLLEQLGDNGRLVGVVRTRADTLGEAILVERTGAGFSRRTLFEAASHILPGFAAAPSFSF